MAVTKKEIIETITSRIGYSHKQSADLLENLLEIMKKSLEDGNDILISGFGKFSVREKGERRGRNPATGDAMMLKPRKVVGFKHSGVLKDRMNR